MLEMAEFDTTILLGDAEVVTLPSRRRLLLLRCAAAGSIVPDSPAPMFATSRAPHMIARCRQLVRALS
jgi:hypothetical protein